MNAPQVGEYWRGAAPIKPYWLAGLRMLVRDVIRRADLPRVPPDADQWAKRGEVKAAHDPGEVLSYHVAVIVRQRVVVVDVDAKNWHAKRIEP
jgi:hypothetical protein